MTRILLIIGILILFGTIVVYASRYKSRNRADHIIRDICGRLYDYDLNSNEKRNWHNFCEEWIKTNDHKNHEAKKNENIIDEQYMSYMIIPRKARASGFRSSRSGSRSSSRRGSGSSSSFTRFRNTHTGVTIYRPSGWIWSRSRSTFLPLATRFSHRSHSSSYRFTTPITNSLIYYYCTSNNNDSIEIQCNSTNGDAQCCEEETTQQAFCCGGEISKDFTEDVNQATQILAQIFYILAAITLSIHIFMQFFY